MNILIVASATFLMMVTAPGSVSGRDAISKVYGLYREEGNGAAWLRVAESEPVTVSIAPATGLTGTAIPLKLKAPMDGLRFILFKDVPADVRFSHGFRLKNSWITSIRDLDTLQIIPIPGFVGSMTFAVFFQRENLATAAAQGIMVVEVNPINAVAEPKGARSQELPTGAVVSLPHSPEPAVRPAPRAPGVSPEEEREELARGANLMRMGDIATARLIYQNLATRASANGARALAETYDPAYLKEVVIAGLRPDIEVAKKWYKVAAELGDSKSATRLSVLDQR